MKRARALIAGVLVVVATAAASASCGDGAGPPRTAANKRTEPTWSDAFDTSPDLVAVMHPQAIRHDAVYGPLLGRLSQLAAARSPAAAATRSLEAFESAEEVLAALAEDGSGMIVLRGVRADLDPARIVDAEGRTLWRTTGVPTRVAEYVRQEGGATASLFVLPERTWVIAVGDARQRAREAFANPSGRPAWKYDRDALVSVRIAGPALLRHVAKLRATGQLNALGHHLQSLTLGLPAGKEGSVTATFTYADEEAAAIAEVTVRRVVEVIKRSEGTRFRWLADAVVARDEPRVLTLRTPLPKELLRDLSRSRDPRDMDDPDLPTPSP